MKLDFVMRVDKIKHLPADGIMVLFQVAPELSYRNTTFLNRKQLGNCPLRFFEKREHTLIERTRQQVKERQVRQ